MPNALPTYRFPSGTCIANAQVPEREPVTPDSPALAVMTDLTKVRAVCVSPQATLIEAETRMIHQGVRMLFVIGEPPCVDGIVTAADVHGEKSMRLVQQRHLKHGELIVGDVMAPLHELNAIDYSSVVRANVAQLVATLLKLGHGHLLVMEGATANSPPRVRGIVSLTQVERQLGMSLNSVEIATTFAEIKQALA